MENILNRFNADRSTGALNSAQLVKYMKQAAVLKGASRVGRGPLTDANGPATSAARVDGCALVCDTKLASGDCVVFLAAEEHTMRGLGGLPSVMVQVDGKTTAYCCFARGSKWKDDRVVSFREFCALLDALI